MLNILLSVKKYTIYGTIPICLIATLNHFLYKLSGNNTIVAIFTPINECVWEHLKLAFYPTILWWILGYFLYNKKTNIHINKWISSMIISLFISPVIILAFYYTYTGALGIESVVLDIFSLVLGVFIGQIVAINYYQKHKYSPKIFILLLSICIIYTATLTYFTFYPPNFPIFIDSTTGIRGIYLK